MRTTRINKQDFTVRIDRQSVLGNPFVLDREDSRDAVVAAFRKYLWRVLNGQYPIDAAYAVSYDTGLNISTKWICCHRVEILRAIAQLKDCDILGCWCSPKSCHGDVIISCWTAWKMGQLPLAMQNELNELNRENHLSKRKRATVLNR